MSVIDNMLNLMKALDINQNELCDYLHIGTSTMSNWKTRGTDPPAKYIIPICEFLNVSPERLLTGNESTAQAASELSENEQEMLELFEKFTDREQIKIIGKIEDLLAEKQRRAIAAQNQANIKTAYVAARISDKHPPKTVTGNFSDIENAPDVTDEY